MNQVAVWIDCEEDMDLYDLRNLVKDIVQGHLCMVGFLKGFAYDLEITRVINRDRKIDEVFGIDIRCLAEPRADTDLHAELTRLRKKVEGDLGIYLRRCFDDLAGAMKHAIDTAFYCYRAIESLRHHCARIHGLTDAAKDQQWAKFREVAGCTEAELLALKVDADPLRHGEAVEISGSDRERMLTSTWGVVESYIRALPE